MGILIYRYIPIFVICSLPIVQQITAMLPLRTTPVTASSFKQITRFVNNSKTTEGIQPAWQIALSKSTYNALVKKYRHYALPHNWTSAFILYRNTRNNILQDEIVYCVGFDQITGKYLEPEYDLESIQQVVSKLSRHYTWLQGTQQSSLKNILSTGPLTLRHEPYRPYRWTTDDVNAINKIIFKSWHSTNPNEFHFFRIQDDVNGSAFKNGIAKFLYTQNLITLLPQECMSLFLKSPIIVDPSITPHTLVADISSKQGLSWQEQEVQKLAEQKKLLEQLKKDPSLTIAWTAS